LFVNIGTAEALRFGLLYYSNNNNYRQATKGQSNGRRW